MERHEGGVTPEQTDARVRRLEDPAIADDAARPPGRDASKGKGRHKCDEYATRIADPDAFAVCFDRGVEHPRVRNAFDIFKDELRQALERPGELPDEVWDEIARIADKSKEKFLAEVWRERYPDEPLSVRNGD